MVEVEQVEVVVVAAEPGAAVPAAAVAVAVMERNSVAAATADSAAMAATAALVATAEPADSVDEEATEGVPSKSWPWAGSSCKAPTSSPMGPTPNLDSQD